MNRIAIVFAVFLTACSSESDSFCECLAAGKELNDYTENLLSKTEINKTDEQKVKELSEAKDVACADYQLMSGEKMLELKKECSDTE